jgi:hypothetical protein
MCGLDSLEISSEVTETRDLLFSSWIRRIPQGMPTAAIGSELNDAGFSHRRVMAGLSSVDLKMARPREDMSPVDVYMFPVLTVCSAGIGSSTPGAPTLLPDPAHTPTTSCALSRE